MIFRNRSEWRKAREAAWRRETLSPRAEIREPIAKFRLRTGFKMSSYGLLTRNAPASHLSPIAARSVHAAPRDTARLRTLCRSGFAQHRLPAVYALTSYRRPHGGFTAVPECVQLNNDETSMLCAYPAASCPQIRGASPAGSMRHAQLFFAVDISSEKTEKRYVGEAP